MDGLTELQYQVFQTDDNGAHSYVQLYRTLMEGGGMIYEEVPWGANGHLVIYSLPKSGRVDDALQMVPEELDGKVAAAKADVNDVGPAVNDFLPGIQPPGGGEL
jgi:hypothetical protein